MPRKQTFASRGGASRKFLGHCKSGTKADGDIQINRFDSVNLPIYFFLSLFLSLSLSSCPSRSLRPSPYTLTPLRASSLIKPDSAIVVRTSLQLSSCTSCQVISRIRRPLQAVAVCGASKAEGGSSELVLLHGVHKRARVCVQPIMVVLCCFMTQNTDDCPLRTKHQFGVWLVKIALSQGSPAILGA